MKSTDPDRFYVYRHRKADTGRVFYVGKGSGRRAWSIHQRNKKWKSIASAHGVIVEILMCGLTEDAALNLERQWISIVGIDNLATFTLGGGGISGYEHTASTRERMSNSHKGRPMAEDSKIKLSETIRSSTRLIEARRVNFSGHNNPMNKDTNRKLHSERMKINNPMNNKDTIDKMRTSKSGYKASVETRKKQSEALRGKPWSEARRAAQQAKESGCYE